MSIDGAMNSSGANRGRSFAKKYTGRKLPVYLLYVAVSVPAVISSALQ